MNKKFAKKLLAVTIAASMLVVPVTAGATSPSKPAAPAAEETQVSVAEVPSFAWIPASGTATTINGAFAARSIKGMSIKTPVSAIGFPAGTRPFAKNYDITSKSAKEAFAALEAAMKAYGGTRFLAIFNFELGFFQGNQYALTTKDQTFDAVMGISGAKADKQRVAQAVPGGEVNVFEDQDTNASTVTANGLKGGLSAIGIFE